MNKTLLAIILLIVIGCVGATTLISNDNNSNISFTSDALDNAADNPGENIEENNSDELTFYYKSIQSGEGDNSNIIKLLKYDSDYKASTKSSKSITDNYSDNLRSIAQKALNSYGIENSYLGVPDLSPSDTDDTEIFYNYPAYIIKNGKKLHMGHIMISNKQGLIADDIDPYVTDVSPYYTDNKEEFTRLAQKYLDECNIQGAYLGEPEISITEYANQNTFDFPVYTNESMNESIGHIFMNNTYGLPETEVNINWDYNDFNVDTDNDGDYTQDDIQVSDNYSEEENISKDTVI